MALSLLQDAREDYLNQMRSAGIKADIIVLEYFDQLGTNWSVAIANSIANTNPCIRELQTDMRFYFLGQKKYPQETIDSLLHPIIPLSTVKILDRNARANLARADLEIRLAWFRLLEKLTPKKVMEDDPRLTVVGLARQYLRNFSEDYLYTVMTNADLDLILGTFDNFPDFSDSYLQNLVSSHERHFPGVGHFAHLNGTRSRYQTYKDVCGPISPPDYFEIYQFTRNLLINRPDIFESRMLALEEWINNELEHIASVIDAADKSKDGKSTLASHNLNFVNQALTEIANANIPQTNHLQANVVPKLTEQNLDLVRELNKYLRYRGQSFDVDYVSKSSADLAALQAGDWKKAAAGIQPDDASENLSLPIAILADYAKRSTNDTFKVDLMLIQARLEGLRDRASKLAAQTGQDK